MSWRTIRGPRAPTSSHRCVNPVLREGFLEAYLFWLPLCGISWNGSEFHVGIGKFDFIGLYFFLKCASLQLELFVVMLVSCCVGCGCMCACCPLGICLGYGRYYHYTYRIPHGPDDPKPPCIAFVHETLGLCFAVPMLLMMMLVDVILLPWMALLYMVAFVWYRCTAGAAGVGRLFRDEDGGPVPVCDALGDYLASLSVVFRFIHRMQ